VVTPLRLRSPFVLRTRCTVLRNQLSVERRHITWMFGQPGNGDCCYRTREQIEPKNGSRKKVPQVAVSTCCNAQLWGYALGIVSEGPTPFRRVKGIRAYQECEKLHLCSLSNQCLLEIPAPLANGGAGHIVWYACSSICFTRVGPTKTPDFNVVRRPAPVNLIYTDRRPRQDHTVQELHGKLPET
jgi:hypothetical protein